jgi:hypothetical protein
MVDGWSSANVPPLTLRKLAHHALEDVAIQIGRPTGSWRLGRFIEAGELAMVNVTITNNTGLRLRNVVARLSLYNAAEIEPYIDRSTPYLDGEESWDILEPYETKSYDVRIRAKSSGQCRMTAWISAEVIPRAGTLRATRMFNVY